MRGLKRGQKTLLDDGILLLTRLLATLREHEYHITVANQVIRKTERTASELLKMGECGGNALLTGNVESLQS